MKVLIVFCLAISTLATGSSRVHHQYIKVKGTEFQEWQLLTSAKEDNELIEETSESVENAIESDDKDQSTDSIESSKLDSILFKKNKRENLRKLIRHDHTNWEAYKEMHGKVYTNKSEDNVRLKIFLKAQQTIRKHNEAYARGEKDFYLGLNHLSDLLPEEYRRLNGYLPASADSLANENYTTFLTSLNANIPRSVDWRQKGYVTRVKNQGQCGSCWAFSATGALEGQNKRKTGRLVPLSEQNLVDCTRAKPYGNLGCKGGWAAQSFQYVKDNRGIDTESSYPYEGKDSQCRFKRQFVGAVANGFVRIKKGDEGQLQNAVATIGPVSVGIDASHSSFGQYKGGIYYQPGCEARKINHEVLVVGYGRENGKDYWIVKNSWSPNWGEKGYIRMARNRGNHCGIAETASYPLI
uniref:Cathepsin L-like n=1 Tax=Plectus sambesii TaxID=2011161 RepID=A0A914X5P0_9BILA